MAEGCVPLLWSAMMRAELIRFAQALLLRTRSGNQAYGTYSVVPLQGP